MFIRQASTTSLISVVFELSHWWSVANYVHVNLAKMVMIQGFCLASKERRPELSHLRRMSVLYTGGRSEAFQIKVHTSVCKSPFKTDSK